MKKNLFMMAAATAMLFTACTNSDDVALNDRVINENAPQPVEFGTYLGKTDVTRAYSAGTITNETTGDNSLRTAEFGVFGYYTGTNTYTSYQSGTGWNANFMWNQKITWGSSLSSPNWTYSPEKYWPNGQDGNGSGTALQKEEQYLSFFAYAPYTVTTSNYTGSDVPASGAAKATGKTDGILAMTDNNSASQIYIKYKMANANQNNAVDLLWGTRGTSQYNLADGTDTEHTVGATYNTDLTKQKTGERVSFLLKHALAKIGGSVKNDETGATDPKFCGFKVVVDVDANNTANTPGTSSQTTYFSNDFANTRTLVTLESVKIQDGKSAYDDATTALTTSTTSTLNNTGWFNIETGTWTNGAVDGTGATYNITATNGTKDVSNNVYELNAAIKEPTDNDVSSYLTGEVGSKAWGHATVKGVEVTTAKDVFSNADNVPGLLVIPGTSGQDLYITVKYWVRTVDENLNLNYTQVSQTITNKVSLASLEANKYYTIVMHLGLTSVKFEAVVADWATADGGTYNPATGEYTSGGTTNTTSVWLPSNVVGE